MFLVGQCFMFKSRQRGRTVDPNDDENDMRLSPTER